MTDFQRLEEIKKYLGLSYLKMAAVMNFTSAQVFYDIKSGKCGISYDTAKKIQEYFKNISRPINFDWVYKGRGEMFKIDATSTPTDLLSEAQLRERIRALEKVIEEKDKRIAELQDMQEARINDLQEKINTLAMALAEAMRKGR